MYRELLRDKKEKKHAEDIRRFLQKEIRRVVGSIWNVGDGVSSSRPVRNANSGNLLKVD